MDSIPTQPLFIGGRLSEATSGETFENFNPATGQKLCDVQIASSNDVNQAVASAKEAFNTWSSWTGAERGRVLRKAADLLRERNEELAQLEVKDTGKPISEAAYVDILSGADAIEYFAGVAASLHGQHFDLGGTFAMTRREPLGVCAGIGAWNYPIQIACWKSAPALACGNTMVFKPSELTPLTATKLAEIFIEAGVPEGVFNVVQGDANTGMCLSQHPDVAKVSLTGEVETGKAVMRDAAGTLKAVTMELGGKSPLIIFDDADMENAVSAALMANFYTQGEVCSNGTRVFVHESIKSTFIEKLIPRVKAIKIGDPQDPSTLMGSLISQEHCKKVMSYIQNGITEGATCLTGGKKLTEGALAEGSFVEPTVFDDCKDSMSIVREEIFGPVMTLLSFSNEEEVIRRANDTQFGLAAGVFTKDIQRAHRVVAQLEAGTCWINNYNITPIEMPFGGCKASGIGRENSLAAIEHYTQLKSVYVEMGNVDSVF